MENDYDFERGDWVTAGSRYEAVAGQTRFAGLAAESFIGPEGAWAQLMELLAEVPEELVHFVGSGPLERFIHRHGAAFVDALEAAAWESERFRAAVLEVNLEAGTLPAAVEARLVAAFGPRFALLPRGFDAEIGGATGDPERTDA